VTELERKLMDHAIADEAHWGRAPVDSYSLPSSRALMAAREATSSRQARRMEWAVAGLCGAVVALVGMRVVDRG
jgi:hypothetical protein